MRHAYAIGLIALLACSTASVERVDVRSTSSAIINGSPDTTHPAVVALLIGTPDQIEGYCSGTIVKVDPVTHVGWVATAAHCVNDGPVTYVYSGPEYGTPSTRTDYPVIDTAFDSRFVEAKLEDGYDFGIVRFAGADATTPVIPLTTAPDNMTTGSSVTSVGYGLTSRPSEPDAQTTSRNQVTKSLGFVSETLLTYDSLNSGACLGDSGGPFVAGDGATLRVVGIHSYKEGDCDGEFGAARVTSGLDFYATQFAKPLPPENCARCRVFANAPTGACGKHLKECLAEPKCRGFAECYNGGGTYEECADKWPLGEGPFSLVYYCPCNEECTTFCKVDPYCTKAPKCGLPANDGTCGNCLDGDCCAEESACSKDAQCFACIRSGATSCPGNDAWTKLATCGEKRCAGNCPDLRPPQVVDAGAPVTTSPVADAGAEAGPLPAAPKSNDGGCHVTPARGSMSLDWLVLLGLVVVRLRPYRSARR